MNYAQQIKGKTKAVFIMACMFGLAFILNGCGGSSGGAVDDAIGDLTVTISGTITDVNGTAVAGVAVEGVYVTPGGLLNPTTTTAANGTFTLPVIKNDAVYLRGTKTGHVTMNSAKVAYSANQTSFDVTLPTTTEAQDVISAAFPGVLLGPFAWLAVDVVDMNTGDGMSGLTIMPIPAPTADAHTDCDGSNGGSMTTVAPCVAPDRQAPMYLAYYGAAAEVIVNVSSGAAGTAPMAVGEITYLEFEL